MVGFPRGGTIKYLLTNSFLDSIIVTRFAKIDHLRASTDIHFLPVHERYVHPCTIQKHQAPDDRLPGLLLQTAFYRCCETTRVHFMVLRGINRTVYMGYQAAPHASLGLLCGLCQFVPQAEGTALLFESE